ncbi:glutamate receptor ionotropic, NMDA 2B [Eurytemora carolleeae]|uniref:glutamate receptor ionotropic, NMDA 2B n=1 Tax=Eurytemora carolleeae TaxID=1294199 RepID=UPI000C757D28|nr:glutamate receptor ionotropic, NMDA 2B [Eurytemora carolleeae]|eukprot:XP_023329329.1 glutamate receptor ionotropic, NMDA 2B-like [Eurytemora affinis]
MLGVHFPTDTLALIREINTALSVFSHGLNNLYLDRIPDSEKLEMLQPNVSCQDHGAVKWPGGRKLHKYLAAVKIRGSRSDQDFEFNNDGSLKNVELKVMNLRPRGQGMVEDGAMMWEEIGVWKSLNAEKINIKDIVWPGNALKPPEGVPERRFLTITFLEEPPYINLSPPTACSSTKGAVCQMVPDSHLATVNITEEMKNPNSTMFQCCSGFCVDLLRKFSADLSFDYALKRVKDGQWGGIQNGTWNGLVAELIKHETDMVLTSLKINSGRESVIDFSIPFLETGITILVSKRTGIISPTAFLEPFDFASWMLVVVVTVQVAATSIFLFEWLSPHGYNMKQTHSQGRFSYVRTLWLVWVVLFKAAVNVDCPQEIILLLQYIFALFALIFLAIYTANLAAFMITREEYYDLSGVEDIRLSNPYSHHPVFRFGTIPNGATDFVMKNNFPEMHMYMKKFSRKTVKEGTMAVKSGALDAFIYDATVLEYLVGQDDECNILTVGSWYAMTGYGLAFPKSSKWIPMFNEYLMIYRENGDLERLQRFWFTGACKPGERKRSSSKPLALAQFMSAFILLGSGACVSVLFLIIEHFYYRYMRRWMGNFCIDHEWWNLVSLSMATSIRKDKESREECACKNPNCKKRLVTAERDLKLAQAQVEELKIKLQALDCDEPSVTDKLLDPPSSRDLRFVNPLHGEYGGWTPESVQDEIGFDSADSADFLEARVGFEEIETVL